MYKNSTFDLVMKVEKSSKNQHLLWGQGGPEVGLVLSSGGINI